MPESDIASQVTEWLDEVSFEVGTEDQFRSCLMKIVPYIDNFKNNPDDDLFEAITASGTWFKQKLTNTELTKAHSTNLDTIHKAFVSRVYALLGERLSDAKLRQNFEGEYDTDIEALRSRIASSYDGLFHNPHVPINERRYIVGKRGRLSKRKDKRPPAQKRLTREQWIAEDYSMTDDIRDLETQIAELNKRLEYLKGISEAKEKVDAFIKETGYTFEDLYPTTTKAEGKTTTRKKYPPLYQDPANPKRTWNGRGKTPQWLLDYEAAGRNREEFRYVKKT